MFFTEKSLSSHLSHCVPNKEVNAMNLETLMSIGNFKHFNIGTDLKSLGVATIRSAVII